MLLKHGRRPSTLWRWAMVCLLAFFALPMVGRVIPLGSEDLVDGIHGALLGAAIALMTLSGVLKRRLAESGDHHSRS
jgi:hypothetical protein